MGSNSTNNDTVGGAEAIVLGGLLGGLVLTTIIGNLFVVFAILLEHDLKRPQYYLIWSLAVADLMVGVAVMPIAAVYELQGRWTLGVTLCDFWVSTDVLACTASILHLVTIALDRYWSITNVTYMQRRTVRRICSMLAAVWLTSLAIASAPLLGWKDDEYRKRIVKERVCIVSQAISYQIFSTMTAFYVPLAFIIIIYWRVFEAAKRRFSRERQRKSKTPTVASTVTANNLDIQTACNALQQPEADGCGNGRAGAQQRSQPVTRQSSSSALNAHKCLVVAQNGQTVNLEAATQLDDAASTTFTGTSTYCTDSLDTGGRTEGDNR